MLSILNVGEGDTKITFDSTVPEEIERAKTVVTDMLKRGYAILVHVGEQDGKAIYNRATAFDEKTLEYIIAGVPEIPPSQVGDDDEAVPAPQPKGKYRGGSRKRVPATNRAVGVARTAGGMSDRVDSIEYKNLEKYDRFATTRNALRKMAAKHGDWAGIPMPIEGHELIVEPKYIHAEIYKEKKEPEKYDDEAMVWKQRNTFYSTRTRCDIGVYENGKQIKHVHIPAIHSLRTQLFTMGGSDAWGIEQEANALQLLATLIPHHALKKYLLAGAFLEHSKRSGITYMFRKLRPTIAMSDKGGEMRIVASLCMHPIAYYAGSWAGAMCPTDDIVAHLMLMRGDEHMYWRRCNQHPAYRPEAGL